MKSDQAAVPSSRSVVVCSSLPAKQITAGEASIYFKLLQNVSQKSKYIYVFQASTKITTTKAASIYISILEACITMIYFYYEYLYM